MKTQIVPGKPFIAKKKIQCAECKEILFSRYQGHYCRCKCQDEIFIDETNHYCRIGGRSEKIIFLDDVDETQVLRLQELDKILSQSMKNLYPKTNFKLTSIDPITLFHDSFELSLDDDLLHSFMNLVRIYCTEREAMRVVIEHDVFTEIVF